MISASLNCRKKAPPGDVKTSGSAMGALQDVDHAAGR